MDSEAVVTVRLVRSFEHRNFKPVVFHGVNLDQTVQDFMRVVREDISTRAGLPPPFRTFPYGTRLSFMPETWCQMLRSSSCTNELVMSVDEDDKLILQDGQTLRSAGVANETEVAFFRKEDYGLYKANPRTSW
uniref:Uncharacterized protein n=1 Tax=Nothobranchius furzeri TaxID=105023 RepID=A0A8C6M7J4_NOTFU